jgi:hypothetical protein
MKPGSSEDESSSEKWRVAIHARVWPPTLIGSHRLIQTHQLWAGSKFDERFRIETCIVNSNQLSFTCNIFVQHKIVDSIFAMDSCEKNLSALCRKSWVFPGATVSSIEIIGLKHDRTGTWWQRSTNSLNQMIADQILIVVYSPSYEK